MWTIQSLLWIWASIPLFWQRSRDSQAQLLALSRWKILWTQMSHSFVVSPLRNDTYSAVWMRTPFGGAFVQQEAINAWGHENILSTHSSTIEITRDLDISLRANCVIGVGANKGLVDLSPEFKKLARSSSTEIVIIFESGGKSETVHAKGDPKLTFSHAQETIIRKSSFVCPRTLAVFANKAASDLNRALIQHLRAKEAELHIKIIARRIE